MKKTFEIEYDGTLYPHFDSLVLQRIINKTMSEISILLNGEIGYFIISEIIEESEE